MKKEIILAVIVTLMEKQLRETIDHCKEKHNYDLADILEQHGIDPEKPEGQSVKETGQI